MTNDVEVCSSKWLPFCPTCGVGLLPGPRGWNTNLLFRPETAPPNVLRVWCWTCKTNDPTGNHWQYAILAPRNWFVTDARDTMTPLMIRR